MTAAHERALALWVRTGERDRELDALMWLAEHHSSQDARVRYGRQAEERAWPTGDLLRVVRALRARGRGLAAAADTRDEGVAVLMAAARSAREELDVTGEASGRARWTNLVLSCGESAVDALRDGRRHADAAVLCARLIAEGPDSFGFWSRYERAREQDARNREWGAEQQAAAEAAAGRHAEAAAWWRYAAAVAWHDRGDRSAALRRLRQAQEHARLAGDAVDAEEAAVLADLAHRIQSTAWSRAAFKAHRAAFEQHRRGQDAEAAWRERAAAVAVAGARRAYFRWANPRYFGFTDRPLGPALLPADVPGRPRAAPPAVGRPR